MLIQWRQCDSPAQAEDRRVVDLPGVKDLQSRRLSPPSRSVRVSRPIRPLIRQTVATTPYTAHPQKTQVAQLRNHPSALALVGWNRAGLYSIKS